MRDNDNMRGVVRVRRVWRGAVVICLGAVVACAPTTDAPSSSASPTATEAEPSTTTDPEPILATDSSSPIRQPVEPLPPPSTVPVTYERNAEGVRIVVAEERALRRSCGAIFLPESGELSHLPLIDDEAAAVFSDLADLGFDSGYTQYRWHIVTRDHLQMALLGEALEPDADSRFANVDVRRGDDGWVGGWHPCQPEAISLDVAPDAMTWLDVIPEPHRSAIARMQADAPPEPGDVAVLERLNPIDLPELFPPRAARWMFDPETEPDPADSFVSLLIGERQCAGARVPEDRGVFAVVEPGTNSLVVFVQPSFGFDTCPGNPPYPVVVDLGRPLGTEPWFDSAIGEARLRSWPPSESDLLP